MPSHKLTFSTSIVLTEIDPRDVWNKLINGEYRDAFNSEGHQKVSDSTSSIDGPSAVAELEFITSKGVDVIVDSMGNKLLLLHVNGKKGEGCVRCGRSFNWPQTGIPLDHEDLHKTSSIKILKVEDRYCDFECAFTELNRIINGKNVSSRYISSLSLILDLFTRIHPGEKLRLRADHRNRKYYGGTMSDEIYYSTSHMFKQIQTIPTVYTVDVLYMQQNG